MNVGDLIHQAADTLPVWRMPLAAALGWGIVQLLELVFDLYSRGD